MFLVFYEYVYSIKKFMISLSHSQTQSLLHALLKQSLQDIFCIIRLSRFFFNIHWYKISGLTSYHQMICAYYYLIGGLLVFVISSQDTVVQNFCFQNCKYICIVIIIIIIILLLSFYNILHCLKFTRWLKRTVALR